MTKLSNYTRINIAIRPPKNIENSLIQLSRKIGRKTKAYFIIDGIGFYPHATLYYPEIPTVNLEKALGLTEKITKNFSKFLVSFNAIRAHWGFIYVEIALSKEIRELHRLVVHNLNLLREGHVRKKYQSEEGLKKFSKDQRESIQLYGYPNVMDLFRPHFTIIRLTDDQKAQKLAHHYSWPVKKAEMSRVSVFKMGEHGTCREIIQDFTLNG